jgi:hypothetical protein
MICCLIYWPDQMPAENINLFLVNGNPDGLRIATIGNWDGKAFGAPRSELKQLLIRKEMGWAGIYFLLGQNDKTGDLTAYVGVAKLARNRLTGHGEKDWTHVIVFVSENLHEGHVKHLEGFVLEEAKKIARYKVTNDKASGSPLPEHECANMEVFLNKIRLLLPLLDCDILTPTRPKDETGQKLKGEIRNLVAYGQRTSKGFVVFAGSQAVKEYRGSASEYMKVAREKLITEKKLVSRGNIYEFTKDCEFSTPTSAANPICGGYVNGLTFWKTEDGKTLKKLDLELNESVFKQFSD